MNRDRRQVVVIAGALAAISASLPRISGALRIPEAVVLCAVGAAEALLVIRLYVISRRSRNCGGAGSRQR